MHYTYNILNHRKTEGAHLRPSDDKAPTRLQMVDGLVVDIFGRHHSFDDLLLQNTLLLLQRNVVVMLDGDDHCVDTQRNHSAILLLVVHSDLKLCKKYKGTHLKSSFQLTCTT